MATKAQSGRGSIIAIGGVTGVGGSEAFTPIGEVMEAPLSGTSVGTDDASSFDSGFDEEFITLMRNNGEYTLSGNRVSSNAGQAALQVAYDSGNKYDFKLTLPKAPGQSTTADSFAFSALVMSQDFAVGVKSIIKFTVKLKVSGAITPTLGS